MNAATLAMSTRCSRPLPVGGLSRTRPASIHRRRDRTWHLPPPRPCAAWRRPCQPSASSVSTADAAGLIRNDEAARDTPDSVVADDCSRPAAQALATHARIVGARRVCCGGLETARVAPRIARCGLPVKPRVLEGFCATGKESGEAVPGNQSARSGVCRSRRDAGAGCGPWTPIPVAPVVGDPCGELTATQFRHLPAVARTQSSSGVVSRFHGGLAPPA